VQSFRQIAQLEPRAMPSCGRRRLRARSRPASMSGEQFCLADTTY
jgi:hypothetical protein